MEGQPFPNHTLDFVPSLAFLFFSDLMLVFNSDKMGVFFEVTHLELTSSVKNCPAPGSTKSFLSGF